jgi:hypothetical protein
VIVANKGCQVELEFAMPNHGQLHRKLWAKLKNQGRWHWAESKQCVSTNDEINTPEKGTTIT